MAMALIALGVAACGNAGKLLAHQGNPLALNYPQWLAFARAVTRAVGERPMNLGAAVNANRIELDIGWAKLHLQLDELEAALGEDG